MNLSAQAVRTGLYIERFAISFATGIFALLPLYFQEIGKNVVFFGKVYAIGAISTLLCTLFSTTLIRRFGLEKLAPLGSVCYGLGSLLFYIAAVKSHTVLLYMIASLLLGAGWGLIFTLGSICVTSTIGDGNRAYYFTIYAAFSTLGVGTAPVICSLLMKYCAFGFGSLFVIAVLLCVVAFALQLYLTTHNQFYITANIHKAANSWHDMLALLKTDGIYFFIMVLLGACVYTTIINLQTTYAQANHVPYEIFYLAYSVSVVFSRFFLSKPLSRCKMSQSIPALLILMLIGLGLLFLTDFSVWLYALSSCLLGISYGLVYPLIQGEATHHSPANLRTQALVVFSFSYFIAVYCFPYFGALLAVKSGYDALIVLLIVLVTAELGVAYFFYNVRNKKAETT